MAQIHLTTKNEMNVIGYISFLIKKQQALLLLHGCYGQSMINLGSKFPVLTLQNFSLKETAGSWA